MMTKSRDLQLTAKNSLAIICTLFAFAAVYISYNTDFWLAIYPGFFSLMTLSIIVVGVGIFYYGYFLTNHMIILSLIALWGWTLGSCFWAEYSWVTLEGLRRTTTFVLSFAAVYLIFRQIPQLQHHFFHCFLAIAFVCGVYYVGFMISKLPLKPPYGFHRPFGNPNMAGSFLGFAASLATVLGLSAWQKQKYKKAWCYALYTFLLLIIILFVRSKGALLAYAVIVTLCLWILCARLRYIIATITVVVVACIAIYFSPILERIWPSVEIRLVIWKDTLSAITYNPFTFVCGWGTGNFFPVYESFRGPESYTTHYQANVVDFPHGYFLEILCELGLIGLILFLLPFGYIVKITLCLWREQACERYFALALLLATLMLLLQAQVSVAFSYPQTQFLVAIVLAWFACQKDTTKLVIKKNSLLTTMAIVLLVVFWKFCAWDSLVFHYQYKQGMRERIKNPQQFPEKLITVFSPPVKNYHTLSWRRYVGAALIDHFEQNPRLVKEKISIFTDIEKFFPQCSNLWFWQAILYAKQGQVKEANGYFQKFAQKNPFLPDLWIYWAIFCRQHPQFAIEMYNTSVFCIEKYQPDGALLFGQSLALRAMGKKVQAKVYAQKAKQWAQEKSRKRLSLRVAKILEISEQLLGE